MSQQTEAKETWVDLEKKLLPYQRASVDKICKHFENSGKALLADEVGLGKTFVRSIGRITSSPSVWRISAPIRTLRHRTTPSLRECTPPAWKFQKTQLIL